MALSEYVLRRLEESSDECARFEDFKLDDYDGPTSECQDTILAVVWKYVSRKIISQRDAWICLTPLIPFLGYTGEFRVQRHNALERAREDGICIRTVPRTDAIGLDTLGENAPILNPLLVDDGDSNRGNPKADFMRLSDLQPFLMNTRTRDASVLNRILAHELNWAEMHRIYTTMFYARRADEKDKAIASQKEEMRKAEERLEEYKGEMDRLHAESAKILDDTSFTITRIEEDIRAAKVVRQSRGQYADLPGNKNRRCNLRVFRVADPGLIPEDQILLKVMRGSLSHNRKTEAELRDNFAEVEKIAGIGDHPNAISNWVMIRERNRRFLTRTSVRGRRGKKFEMFKVEKGGGDLKAIVESANLGRVWELLEENQKRITDYFTKAE